VAAQEESRAAVKAGQVLNVQDLGSGAALLQAHQKRIAAGHQEADLGGELRDLIGWTPDATLDLAPADIHPPRVPPLATVLAAPFPDTPEIRSAAALEQKAQDGVRLARLDYVPDVSAFVKYTNQSGVPFVKSDFVTVGVQATWTLFDGGKRGHGLSQHAAEAAQARENLRRTRNRVRLDTEKAYRKLEDATGLLEVADAALRFQEETLRIAGDQRSAGLISPSRMEAARLEAAKARLEALQARLGVCLAGAEIERILGLALQRPE